MLGVAVGTFCHCTVKRLEDVTEGNFKKIRNRDILMVKNVFLRHFQSKTKSHSLSGGDC